MSDGVYGLVAQEVFTADRDTAVDVQPLGAMLLGEYVRAKSDRQNTELRWLMTCVSTRASTATKRRS